MKATILLKAMFWGALAPNASAQWPTVPSDLLEVSTDVSTPHMAAAPDGGVWLTWWKQVAPGQNFQPRIQRVNDQGEPQFIGGGISAFDISSSLDGLALTVDGHGDAWVAAPMYGNQAGVQGIDVQKIKPSGDLAWSLGSLGLPGSQPRLFPLSDGQVLLAWAGGGADVQFQKYDEGRVKQWAVPAQVDYSGPLLAWYELLDVQNHGAGFVASFVRYRDIGCYHCAYPDSLYAQRYDGLGNPLWGSEPIEIVPENMDGQVPSFMVGNSGEVYFAYPDSGVLTLERRSASGVIEWAEVVDTGGFQAAFPLLACDPYDDGILVLWQRKLSTGYDSLSMQKYDSGGNVMWSPGGVLVHSGPGALVQSVSLVAGGTEGGASVFFRKDSPQSFQDGFVVGAHVSPAGILDHYGLAASNPLLENTSGNPKVEAVRTGLGIVVLALPFGPFGGPRGIGLQGISLVGSADAGATLGGAYCTAEQNSTGQPAEILAYGVSVAALNSFTLHARQLPHQQFGFFLTSKTQGFTPLVQGSQGNLCLGGAIGRYNRVDQIFFTGGYGAAPLKVDLTQTPTPTTPVAVLAGETWNYQAWYRDLNPTSTSNFTNGVSVTF